MKMSELRSIRNREVYAPITNSSQNNQEVQKTKFIVISDSKAKIQALQERILDSNTTKNLQFKESQISQSPSLSINEQFQQSKYRSENFVQVYTDLNANLNNDLQLAILYSPDSHQLKFETMKVSALKGFWQAQSSEDKKIEQALSNRKEPLTEAEEKGFQSYMSLREQIQIEMDTLIQVGRENADSSSSLIDDLKKINMSLIALANGADLESANRIIEGSSTVNKISEDMKVPERSLINITEERSNLNADLDQMSLDGKAGTDEYISKQVESRRLGNLKSFFTEQLAQDIHLEDQLLKNKDMLQGDSPEIILFKKLQEERIQARGLTDFFNSDNPNFLSTINGMIDKADKLFILQNALLLGVKASTVEAALSSEEIFNKLPEPDLSMINDKRLETPEILDNQFLNPSPNLHQNQFQNPHSDKLKPGLNLSKVGNFAQLHKSCGAAALANVLFYYGIDLDTNKNGLVDENNVFKDFNDNEAKPIQAIVDEAHRRGFATGVKENANYEDIEHYIRNGIPPILLIDSSFSRGISDHYVTVTGIDMEKQTISYNSNGKSITTSIAEFDKGWRTDSKFSLHKRRTIIGIATPDNAHNLLASKISKFSQLKDDALYAYALFQDKEYLDALNLGFKTAGGLIALGVKEVGYNIDREVRRNVLKAQNEAKRVQERIKEEAKRVADEAKRAKDRVSNEVRRVRKRFKL